MSGRTDDSNLSPMEQLLGQEILTANKEKKGETTFASKPTKQLFRDKELVLLYFSASWCPPCQTFSPVLIDFYQKHAAAGKFEIVYVSSDRSLEEFEGYYAKMPWLAIPTNAEAATIKNTLATRLGIRGIPSLIVLQVETGLFVTSQAREQVQRNVAKDAASVKALLDEWKAAQGVTLEEGASGGGFSLGNIVMTILKNPIYIFGMLYLVKWLMRQWNQWNKQDAALEEGAAAQGAAEEQEF